VQWLVQDAKADVAATAEYGATALHDAAHHGQLAVVQWLVQDAKADVAAVTGDGVTALHCAAEKGHLAVVQWLVQDAKADVAAITANGACCIALRWSAAGAAQGVAAILQVTDCTAAQRLRGGPVAGAACPRQMRQQLAAGGATALLLAARNGHSAVAQWLVQDAKADVS